MDLIVIHIRAAEINAREQGVKKNLKKIVMGGNEQVPVLFWSLYSFLWTDKRWNKGFILSFWLQIVQMKEHSHFSSSFSFKE